MQRGPQGGNFNVGKAAGGGEGRLQSLQSTENLIKISGVLSLFLKEENLARDCVLEAFKASHQNLPYFAYFYKAIGGHGYRRKDYVLLSFREPATLTEPSALWQDLIGHQVCLQSCCSGLS